MGIPSHAARQLPNGRWTSKCGQAEDIEHDLRDLEGRLYGKGCVLHETAKIMGKGEISGTTILQYVNRQSRRQQTCTKSERPNYPEVGQSLKEMACVCKNHAGCTNSRQHED